MPLAMASPDRLGDGLWRTNLDVVVMFTDGTFAFSTLSGETHRLGPAAGEVLKLLSEGPATYPELCLAFGLPPPAESLTEEHQQLARIVDELSRAGLILHATEHAGWARLCRGGEEAGKPGAHA